MDNYMINKIKYYASVVGVVGVFLGGLYLSSIPEQNRKEREKKEQIEYVHASNRTDSLANLYDLVSRLEGYDDLAEWMGAGFKDSLELKYERVWGTRNDTMPRFMKVTFEDYLTLLYVDQERNKLDQK